MNDPTTDTDRISHLGTSLDVITEPDFCALAGITSNTAEAWRKRHCGPAYVLLGRKYYYPRQAVTDYLQSLVRERKPAITAKDLL